jgi:glyoxylase I family protein
MKFHHLAILVTDLRRAEAFYVGLLGLPVVMRWEDRSIWIGLEGDAFLAVEKVDVVSPGPCVALAIDKEAREAWRARLLLAGVAVEKESDFTLYFRDPDGNLVGLSHWPDSR